MATRLSEFACFVVMSVGVLMTGTVAVAMAVSRWSLCYEVKAGEPPSCYVGTRPDIWLQTYQAMLVNFALWVVASVILPLLLALITRHSTYLSLQVLWLFVACIVGSGVGGWWTERQYRESYWQDSSSSAPTMLGIMWTLIISWSIIDAKNSSITPKDACNGFPTT
jgi:hypothetical protein